MRFNHLIPLFGLFVCLSARPGRADTLVPQTAVDKNAVTLEQLTTIERDMTWLEQEVDRRRKEQARASKDDAAEMEDDIVDLENRLQKARLSFIATAAEVDLPAPENKNKPPKRDLVQEAQQLIEPLFDAVRRVSEKPRRIEAYRTKIFYLQDELSQIQKAITNLDHVIKSKTYPPFEKQLESSKQDLTHQRDEIAVQLDTFQRKLNEDLEDHRTVIQAFREGMQDFAQSKGKNIIIAFFVFSLIFWSMLSFKRLMFRSHRVRRKVHTIHKPFTAAYFVAAVLASVFATVLTLHFLNDWFLATLILLGLFATVWVVKSTVHLFIHEARIILNLSQVKEGERVIWQGVPWLVDRLSFRSTLVNEALDGGSIALPASAIAGLISRSVTPGEPWFPTRTGNYVLLDDGTYGQVEIQTPETVILRCGSTRKYYLTQDFLSKTPQNFSSGFEVDHELIVRHSSPAHLDLQAIEAKLTKSVSAKLSKRTGGQNPDFKNFEVSVLASSATTTRVFVHADCSGELASQRDGLKREIQAAAGAAWRELS